MLGAAPSNAIDLGGAAGEGAATARAAVGAVPPDVQPQPVPGTVSTRIVRGGSVRRPSSGGEGDWEPELEAAMGSQSRKLWRKYHICCKNYQHFWNFTGVLLVAQRGKRSRRAPPRG